MEFTPIGLLCLIAAPFVIASPRRLGFIILGCFIPLQAAAAANLTAVGNVSIICAHVIMGMLVVGLVLRPRMFASALQYSARNPAIILFGLFAAYAICSAFILPRLFEGQLSVFSLERTKDAFIPLTPLHPSTGNFTQSVYLAANFLFFVVAAFLASRADGIKNATYALNAITIVHLVFAVISVFSSLPPAAMALDFIRTANYTINAHHVIAGAPRIIGSYTEPSAFGAMSVGLFAWNFARFMQTRGLWHLGASVLLIACIVFSLSTTAYAALILLVALWGLYSVYFIVRPGLSSEHITAMLFAGAVSIGLTALLFVEPIREFAIEAYERLFGLKLQSDSGQERGAWNMQSIRNFMDTRGLGVGLGASRGSSLATVLLGNVGFIGTTLYVLFLNRAFLRPWAQIRQRSADPEVRFSRRIFYAARIAALGLLIPQLIAGATIDGGLAFVLMMAIATAAHEAAPRGRHRLVVNQVGARAELSFPERSTKINVPVVIGGER